MFPAVLPYVALRASARALSGSTRISVVASPAITQLVQPAPTWTRSFLTTASTRFPAAKKPAKTPANTAKTPAKSATKKNHATKATKTDAIEPAKTPAPAKPDAKVVREAKKLQALRELYKENKPPKRPLHPWIVFAAEYAKREKTEGDKVPIAQTSKAAAQVWKTLSESEKQHYATEAEKINEARREAWNNYLKTADASTLRSVNQYLGKLKRSRMRVKLPARLKRTSGNIVFFQEQYSTVSVEEDIGGLTPSQYKFRTLAARWKALSEEQKKSYKERAAQINAEKGL